MINVNILRGTLIALLDDEDGIPGKGYDSLRGFVSSLGRDVDKQCCDIWAAVDAVQGRYFLPENHGLQ